MIKICISKIIKKIAIPIKWKADSLLLSIPKESKDIYWEIHDFYFTRFKTFPNLTSPKSYNEKIQWLKLFDQTQLHAICSDKFLARTYVQETIGERYLAHIYSHASSFNELNLMELPAKFVIKTNHDSGTVFPIVDRIDFSIENTRAAVETALIKPYGTENGEWPYRHIKPLVFIEEFIETTTGNLPSDIKLHCVDGKVKFIQYIWDRGRFTKEIILDENWNQTGLILDSSFEHPNQIPEKPENFELLKSTAEKLAGAFKYVRIDLYNENEKILFGEMTFFPRGGGYHSPDSLAFGSLLTFDTSKRLPPFCIQ
ncbi:Uncharacterised protein [BD1-7 clade bacterium]|uniref:Uncharacterized protein n=1 Tax=BD1-7 clade bacterium TaxID=2029982 RepID=A0A5S9MU06_9GAMM|nr:Uncharacterised protein [BD1-7 clade bacterium]